MSNKATTPAKKYLERRKKQKALQDKKNREKGQRAGIQFVSTGERGSAAGFLVRKKEPPKPLSLSDAMLKESMDEADQQALDNINRPLGT